MNWNCPPSHAQVKSGIFMVCAEAECVNNPSSKAAAADRLATMETWERDDADDEMADDEMADDAICEGYNDD